MDIAGIDVDLEKYKVPLMIGGGLGLGLLAWRNAQGGGGNPAQVVTIQPTDGTDWDDIIAPPNRGVIGVVGYQPEPGPPGPVGPPGAPGTPDTPTTPIVPDGVVAAPTPEPLGPSTSAIFNHKAALRDNRDIVTLELARERARKNPDRRIIDRLMDRKESMVDRLIALPGGREPSEMGGPTPGMPDTGAPRAMGGEAFGAMPGHHETCGCPEHQGMAGENVETHPQSGGGVGGFFPLPHPHLGAKTTDAPRPGETMKQLARRVYGDEAAWQRVAALNPGKTVLRVGESVNV